MSIESLPTSINTKSVRKIRETINKNLALLKNNFPDKADIIDAFYSYTNSLSDVSIDILLNSFIGFLDLHFINQIVQHKGDEKSKENRLFAVYGRDKNIEKLHDSIKVDENVYIVFSWKGKGNLFNTEVLKELHGEKYNIVYINEEDLDTEKIKIDENKFNVFVFKFPISVETAYKVSKIPSKTNFLFLGNVNFDNGLCCEFYYPVYEEKVNDENIDEMVEKISSSRALPVNLPDIQSVIKQRLLLGLSIYGTELPKNCISNFSQHTKNSVDFLLGTKNRRIKKTFRINTLAQEDDIKRFNEGHKKHYSRFFSEKGFREPKISLTNSGVGANDAIINYISEKESNLGNWAVVDFYYENIFVENMKRKVDEKTKVLLATPSLLSPKKGLTGKKYNENLKKSINDIIQNAKSNPNEEYYLVVDVTTNLNFQIGDYYEGEIPKNLKIIKTFSLTKHQRGGTNYFMGGICFYGDRDDDKLEKIIEKLGYGLSRFQTIAYPRVTNPEIQRNMENINKNRNAFKEGFYSYLKEKGIDSSLIPEMIDSDYFSFIIFPLLETLYWINNKSFYRGETKNMPIQSLSDANYIKNPLFVDEIISFLKYSENYIRGDINTMDSFGFLHNNLNFVMHNLLNLFDENIGISHTKTYTPRISFGINYDFQSSFDLGRKIAEFYVNKIEELFRYIKRSTLRKMIFPIFKFLKKIKSTPQ